MDRNENGTMVPYYFHTNSIGSIVAITDQNGQLVERVSYDIYGMPIFTDYKTDPQNPTVLENSVIGNDILFQGRRYDKETNLYYFRARYYDPIMGRFLQTDPIGYEDSMNLYQAFNMNGINFVDPFGELIKLTNKDIKVRDDAFGFFKVIFSFLIDAYNIDNYIKLDNEGFLRLKKPVGALKKAGLLKFYEDMKNPTYKAYEKWIRYTNELKTKKSIYTLSLMELFEKMIDSEAEIIEFRIGEKYTKNGKTGLVSKMGGGICLEPHETVSGNIEIVVDPKNHEKYLGYYSLIEEKGKITAKGNKLPLNLAIIIVHEFGHAYASLLGYKSIEDGKTENMFTDIAVMMENLFRIAMGKKRLRPSHQPTLWWGTLGEHVYELTKVNGLLKWVRRD